MSLKGRIPPIEQASSRTASGHVSALTPIPEVGNTYLPLTFMLDIQAGMTLDVSKRPVSSMSGARYRVQKFFVKAVSHKTVGSHLVTTVHCGDYFVEYRMTEPFAVVSGDELTYTECVQQFKFANPARF